MKLIWDEWNKAHIKKHQVTAKEVKEVIISRTITQRSYKNRLMVLGRTKRGKFLTVVASFTQQKDAYVVSARDMSKKERNFYEEAVKN